MGVSGIAFRSADQCICQALFSFLLVASFAWGRGAVYLGVIRKKNVMYRLY